ncbi:Uncharacterised protein [Bordetella pertussis]|nr:Uncharacterised protein [Bordetella pertussis]CFL78186.1 Uncharacterised protein [Bordetella pertussis]CFL81721.1 Uncharacterised protein [Bordetella pertussis]CFL87253.1 Uncharacterised protein [Bordetella pertussis]CFL93173.1 Uncharacterised protein [Bordetella pertussis]
MGVSSSAVVKEAISPVALLATPRQLGPRMATSWARASSPSRRCSAAPASPVSEKPEENTTKARTPAAMPSRITPSTSAAGVPTMARSTGSPMAASDG